MTDTTHAPGSARRRQVLADIAACVCRDRQNTYGDAEDNFADIAAHWQIYLRRRGLLAEGATITALDAAALQGLVKTARKAASPHYLDNWVDEAGYSVCGAGILRKEQGLHP